MYVEPLPGGRCSPPRGRRWLGTRAYLALLFGNGDNDPLFLQVKEAAPPGTCPIPAATSERVSAQWQAGGAGAEWTASLERSKMLGYTDIDGRHYYIRQMKNLKASIPVEWLTGASFNFYAWACGALLARAHAPGSSLQAARCYSVC